MKYQDDMISLRELDRFHNLYDNADYGYFWNPNRNAQRLELTAKKTESDIVWGAKKNVILFGKRNQGKTFLAECIAQEVWRKGASVYFNSAKEIFGDVFLQIVQTELKKQRESPHQVFVAKLLVIDNLGIEIWNRYVAEWVEMLLRIRDNKGLSTIIVTRLAGEQIEARYGSDVLERICRSYDVWTLYGRRRIGCI